MPKVPDAYARARAAEIRRAAAACFGRAGYQGTAMADIAAAAGLSVGALYRYYESKEVLFQALAREAREGNRAMWAEAEAAGDAAAQLGCFVDRFLRNVTDPDCLRSLALDVRLRSEALDSVSVRRELQASYKLHIDSITRLLQAAGVGGKRRAVTESRARALLGVLNEAVTQAMLVPGFDVKAYRGVVLALIESWTGEE